MKLTNLQVAPSKRKVVVSENKHYIFNYKTPTTLSTNTIFKHTFEEVTIQTGKNLKLSLYVPTHSYNAGEDGNDEGLRIALYIYVDGTLYSLGNSGTATNSNVMGQQSKGSYYTEKILDLVDRNIAPSDKEYKLKVEFRMLPNRQSIELNPANNFINKANSFDATYIESVRDQNFSTVTIEEYSSSRG